MRALEKAAVRDGGGCNHRFGLFDMVLIKDTHVKAAGGPGNAVAKVRQSLGAGRSVAIEVEVQSAEEFREAIAERPNRIMLDNMTPGEMTACVALRNSLQPSVELEASGNVSKTTIVAIAETGVDFISAGSITHSARAVDIHLIIV
jgi:nicotinate-nucleotide pyrophosphorylase (carboxylating)